MGFCWGAIENKGPCSIVESANGDIIVSSIINGVGGLACVHHGVEVGEVGIKGHLVG